MAFQNDGVKNRINSIRQIKSHRGISFHPHLYPEKQIFDHQTNTEILEILSYFTNQGKGRLFSKPLEFSQNEIVMWCRNQNNLKWVVYSSSKHTIGIIVQTKRTVYNPQTKSYQSLFPETRFEPIRLCIIILDAIRAQFP
jgi:hypothetical protein